MKSQTDRTILATVFLFLTSVSAFSQKTVINPAEYISIEVGTKTLVNKHSQQAKLKTEISTEIAGIDASFTKMKEWEQQYNSYLKSNDFGATIYSASSLVTETAKTFINLYNISKAVKNNSQGVVASLSLTNLYSDTLARLVTVNKTINTIKQGGKNNMLTGEERTQLLWTLRDELDAINVDLRRLYMSIRHYTIGDMWRNATAGMIDRNPADIAGYAVSRWKATAKEVTIYSGR